MTANGVNSWALLWFGGHVCMPVPAIKVVKTTETLKTPSPELVFTYTQVHTGPVTSQYCSCKPTHIVFCLFPLRLHCGIFSNWVQMKVSIRPALFRTGVSWFDLNFIAIVKLHSVFITMLALWEVRYGQRHQLINNWRFSKHVLGALDLLFYNICVTYANKLAGFLTRY